MIHHRFHKVTKHVCHELYISHELHILRSVGVMMHLRHHQVTERVTN